VLDVGGSSGYVAERLAAGGARVVVIDLDEAALAAARAQGLEAIKVDVTAGELPFAAGEFDLMIWADILEHLADPAAVLARFRPVLRPAGRLVASVPNGANWALRAALLLGRWEYTERGLLDHTHLRNFTRRSFLRTIEAAGYEVTATDLTCPIPRWRGGRLSALAHRLARLRPGLLAYQHLAVARPLATT
jgi:2-polyprenyl-3-methyl-5-hydroxy-6-metoxy-1,4-benzoquinol methylase